MNDRDDKKILEMTSQKDIAVAAFKADSISNLAGIAAASRQIREFIEKSKPHGIIFDFEQVKFFSSQVLGLLLDIRAKLEPSGGKVAISAINPQLHKVFKITNLDKVFKFFPDKASAVEAVSSN